MLDQFSSISEDTKNKLFIIVFILSLFYLIYLFYDKDNFNTNTLKENGIAEDQNVIQKRLKSRDEIVKIFGHYISAVLILFPINKLDNFERNSISFFILLIRHTISSFLDNEGINSFSSGVDNSIIYIFNSFYNPKFFLHIINFFIDVYISNIYVKKFLENSIHSPQSLKYLNQLFDKNKSNNTNNTNDTFIQKIFSLKIKNLILFSSIIGSIYLYYRKVTIDQNDISKYEMPLFFICLAIIFYIMYTLIYIKKEEPKKIENTIKN